jgi:phosphoribosylanthranilate isomerase
MSYIWTVCSFMVMSTQIFATLSRCHTSKLFVCRPDQDPLPEIRGHRRASAILLDAYDPQQAGGTGKQFDWTVARHCVQQSPRPVVLAGGLSASNAAQAINEVRPWALDLSSGVESEPGLKDPERLKAFFNEVNRVRI